MKITEEQFKIISKHINQVAPMGMRCPICGGNNWSVNDTVFQCTEYMGHNMVLGAGVSMMPFVVLICDKCQNSMLLNAIKLGIVNPDSTDNIPTDIKENK